MQQGTLLAYLGEYRGFKLGFSSRLVVTDNVDTFDQNQTSGI